MEERRDKERKRKIIGRHIFNALTVSKTDLNVNIIVSDCEIPKAGLP